MFTTFPLLSSALKMQKTNETCKIVDDDGGKCVWLKRGMVVADVTGCVRVNLACSCSAVP